jgi:nicotinate-nucleotide adenylyltransferase
MRVGLLGGTFDPIHVGHLILAETCRDAAKLDEVWFLPSYVPPHKLDKTITRYEQRCEMVTLATTGQPAFRVETIEKELPPPSYTANTLAELKLRHPGVVFCLLIGGDSLQELPTWKEPARVVQQAELVAVDRPGFVRRAAAELESILGVQPGEVKLTIVNSPLVSISSTDLRADVSSGRSIRFQVPRAVEEFIRERKLYRT